MIPPKAKHPTIRDVRWWTSPACARILERLACRGPATASELARELHIHNGYTAALLRVTLSEARRIHISAWRHNDRGLATPIYAMGPGRNKRRPKPETPAQRCKRRRAWMIEHYGSAIADRVLSPNKYGNPKIYIDGQRITSRSHASHLAGTVTQ